MWPGHDRPPFGYRGAMRRNARLASLAQGLAGLVVVIACSGAACGGAPAPLPPPPPPPPAPSAMPSAAPSAVQAPAGPRWKPRKGPSPEQLFSVHRAANPSLSSDGTRVAFLSDAPGTFQAYLLSGTTTEAPETAWKPVTREKDKVSFVRFVPGDGALFFGRDQGGDENMQIFRAPLGKDGTPGAPVDLTGKPKVRHEMGPFSRDGKRFAFTSTERNGKDFDVYVRSTAAAGKATRIFDADGSFTAKAFSPDGKKLVAHREAWSFDHDLFLLDASQEAKAQKPVRLTPHSGDVRYEDPIFTSDGKALFVLSDKDREFMNVGLLDVATQKLDFVIDDAHDVDMLRASRDGKVLAAVVNVDGWHELRLFDVSDPRAPKRLSAPKLPPMVLSDLDVSADGKFVALGGSSPTLPNELFRVEVATGKAERLTKSDHAGIDEATLSSATLEKTAGDGNVDVPFFVHAPKDLAPGERVPVIVSVHGGPEAQAQPLFNPLVQLFVGHGYAVVQPNVRGSTGYGKRYTHLDDKEKREDSVRDLMAVRKWVATQPWADPARIAVMGGSYGGYMTLAAITLYPKDWAAACDIVGIANFKTFLERTAPYRRALREAEYGALADEALLVRISPIHKVDRIETPLFVIHGKNDPRVPVGEAEQIVDALKKRKVRVEYMRFEDEGHGLAKRENRIAAYGKLLGFFDEVLR
jgi:dipeptidyl aminopeptidase/acylaminoacyl peptidase